MPTPNGFSRSALQRWLRVFVISLPVTWMLLEGALYSARFFRDGTFKTAASYDKELGWIPTPHYVLADRRMQDRLGRAYLRRYSQDRYGARLWGTNPGRPKVLFVGDSFTQAGDVSNDQTYYFHFARLSGLDTYAVGAGGYGTLQEEGLVGRLLRETRLQPDIFVLQFCTNDFVSNSVTLESESIVFEQRIRPYRTLDGRVVYTLGANPAFVAALRWSAVFRAGLRTWEGTLFKRYGGYSRKTLSREDRVAAYVEAFAITERLLTDLKSHLPSHTEAFAFNCGAEEPDPFNQSDMFTRLTASAGFFPLAGARRYVDGGPGGKTGVLASDGAHLNSDGNARLGEFLYQKICARQGCAVP